MPIIDSSYNPPFPFTMGHLSTVYSGLIRQVKGVSQIRERITLEDGDFIDLDWSYTRNKQRPTANQLVIILHGLEGNAQRPYVTGTAKVFNENGFDACAVNFRGCSGEDNRLYRSYHSGVSQDLEQVIGHIIKNYDYQQIVLKGFSLGGNVMLKYLGETPQVPDQIKAGVAVSVPCSLYHSMLSLHRFENTLYARRFRKHLIEKLRKKQERFPDKVTNEDLRKIKLLKDFDDVYTARAHGFNNGLDYYEKASSLPLLRNITIPVLLLNAKNDSFLSPECFPTGIAASHEHLFLEMPQAGGHVGFYEPDNVYYNEKRAVEFINKVKAGVIWNKS
ncbi:YheT family hydrolase [Robertkochia aurantiaca]|uniref:YheT family hydrolase n=1 Tax=Robertkochia aurantiaca TaxID=2873700 RepID=UPI001CCD04FA|nr:alpha/beta fold hydrolase [Robertkochia sp. 3YJGBD-33]